MKKRIVLGIAFYRLLLRRYEGATRALQGLTQPYSSMSGLKGKQKATDKRQFSTCAFRIRSAFDTLSMCSPKTPFPLDNQPHTRSMWRTALNMSTSRPMLPGEAIQCHPNYSSRETSRYMSSYLASMFGAENSIRSFKPSARNSHQHSSR